MSNSMKMKAEYNIEKRAARMPKPPPRSSSASSFLSPPPAKNSSLGVPLPPPRLPSSASSPPPSRPSKLPCPPPPPSGPPVPLPSPLGPGGAFRLPELVELYHSLMKRQAKREMGNMIEEIDSKSSFLSAVTVRVDVETQGDFVQSLAARVRAAAFTSIQHLVSFVKWLDDQLAFLVDEQAVLRHFDWPKRKTDALREAASEYQYLTNLEKKVSSFVDDPKLPCDQALKEMHSLHEKVEKSIVTVLQNRHMEISRYKELGIPIDWLLDSGVVAKIKLASVELARKFMNRVASELDSMSGPKKERRREFLILQGVRFAFRTHQFAGGFDAMSMLAFEELKGRIQAKEGRNIQRQWIHGIKASRLYKELRKLLRMLKHKESVKTEINYDEKKDPENCA
ncbi:Protein chup1, chloroplastic [Asimina triloba]